MMYRGALLQIFTHVHKLFRRKISVVIMMASTEVEPVPEDAEAPRAVLRPAALNQAAIFLSSPQVQKSDDLEGKKRFLAKKGLTEGRCCHHTNRS